MDPLTISALVAGGVGAVSAFGQHRANKDTQHSSHEQMRFQERMSNTAYSRAMKDMKDAGLNPILAYSQGGASSPAGTSYQAQDAIGKGAGTALESRRVQKELEALSSQKAVNASLIQYQAAQANQANSAADLNRVNAETAKYNTLIARNDAYRKDANPSVIASKFYDKHLSSKVDSMVANTARDIRRARNAPVVRNPNPTIQEYFGKRSASDRVKDFFKKYEGSVGKRYRSGK